MARGGGNGLASGRNPQPPPRPIRAYTYAELEAIAAELSPMYRPIPAFVAATGLRPEEWQALERRDVDRDAVTVIVRCRRIGLSARSGRSTRPTLEIRACTGRRQGFGARSILALRLSPPGETQGDDRLR